MRLETFNALPERDAETLLHDCCSSYDWSEPVTAGRPYPSVDALIAQGDVEFAMLTDDQVTDALHGHPRIGERLTDHVSPAWSQQEQAGVVTADAEIREAFKKGNFEYEVRFGHAFLVCADGRSAEELLEVLRERMRNDPATESRVLRAELSRITALRLRRLFA